MFAWWRSGTSSHIDLLSRERYIRSHIPRPYDWYSQDLASLFTNLYRRPHYIYKHNPDDLSTSIFQKCFSAYTSSHFPRRDQNKNTSSQRERNPHQVFPLASGGEQVNKSLARGSSLCLGKFSRSFSLRSSCRTTLFMHAFNGLFIGQWICRTRVALRCVKASCYFGTITCSNSERSVRSMRVYISFTDVVLY